MRRFVAFLVFFACAATANAQSYTYSVYVDADSNAATGCSVVSPGGTLTGIESVLAVTVTAGTPPTVNSVTRSSCSGGVLGAPVSEGTAAVSVGAGVGGTTSIEVSDALIKIAPPSTIALRLYAAAQSASGNDILFTTTGAPAGQAIVLQLAAAPGATEPTPLFGIPALLLLVAALLAVGSRAVRKRMLKRLMLGLVLLSGAAGAAMIFNWNGIGPLATDPPGDSTSGESAIDLRYFFSAFSGSNVFFRFDVNSNLAPPPPKPVAVADTYQATIDTQLNVAAPGVLANDTLNGGTITSNTNPTHGTLVLNVNGGFVYTPNTGYTGQDSFTYTLTNAGGNAVGTVTIVVLNGPSAQPDSYTTIVGTALNVSAPGVLTNDNLGNPTATLQSFGGGSLGGAVTTNAPGASVALGASGGTLTLNANGSINLTAPTTAGTYTFLYRIGNVKGTSDGTVTIQVNQAPTITSSGPANFSVGVNGTYTITTTGTPTVTSITLTGCTLPTGLSFNYTSGATATISGTATVGGTVSCTVTASNGISPNATQTLVVNATAGPVANADNYSTTVGTALNVSAPGVLGNDNLGSPTATLTSFGGGSLGGTVTTNAPGASVALGASGGTLTLNANGSINLTAPTTAGTYTFLYRIGNVQGTSDGTVTIQVNQAPTITSVGPANFSVGTNATYNITTTGTPTVTSITLTGCVLPAGLSFTYTSGANATISGTATATGTVVCTVTASNGIAPQATQSLTVNANAGPAAVADSYTTTVGTALNIAAPGVLSNDTLGFPPATLTKFGGGSLGGSVTDNNAGASVVLTGSGGTLTVNANGSIALTAPTTAGTYTFLYRITNSQGSSDGTVTIQVNQAPTILSPNNVTFTVGTLQTFTITTSGTPTVNSITLTGCVLPAGLSFNYASGATATISGTPTASGNVSCTVTASNGVAPAAIQTLAVAVNQGPAAVADSYSTLVGTALNVSAPGLLQNDTLGNPLATLTFFGGDSLGGVVTDHAAGASVAFGASGGTLTVNADGSLGLTAPTTAGQYTFLYRIANGVSTSDAMVTIDVNQAAAITSAASTTFIDGQANSFGVTTTGFPKPSLSIGTITPALAGVNFVDNGNGTATLSGSPALGTAGTYTFTITAHNGIGADATQPFTLTVNEKPAITSAPTTTFTVGSAGTFSVTTTGTPTPSIARGGVALPSGVNFVDNGNGTGTLSGTPAVGTGGSYAITFTATNTAGSSAVQNFTLVINEAPAITSLATTTFTVGSAGTFTVTTSGSPTPAIARGGVALPSGVNFVDNGNGTGTLSGTPASGSGGTYAITFTASNVVGSSAPQSFTLQVNEAPTITSANTITFSAGVSGANFTVTTTGTPTPAIARSGVALPAGVTFTDNGNGTATLVNNPAAGTGGSYAITFTASNGVGSNAVQSFTLIVNQSPAITSANNTTFTPGVAGTFTVTTTGFPTGASMNISETGVLPGGVTFVNNNNGTATIAGTPAGGSQNASPYPLTIGADNGVAPAASQAFQLNVTCPTITITRVGGGSFPAATYNVGYPAGNQFQATGQIGTIHWSFQSGAQPPGINLTIVAGTLSGIPSATGQFNMTVIATDQTTSCTGTATFPFTINPNISGDSYSNLINNTEAVVTGGTTSSPATPFVPLSGTIVSNDTPASGVTVTSGTFTTSQGGSVTLAADGTFKYTPPLGAASIASDTFSYTGSSNTGVIPSIPQYAPSTGASSASGTVTLNLANRVWYVNPNAGSNGNGQSQSPWSSTTNIKQLPTAGGAASGDTIFVYNGSVANLNANIPLLASQTLWGEGVALVVNSTTLRNAGTAPTLSATGANVVSVNDGNTIKGVTLSNSTNALITGAPAGLTVDTVTMTPSGSASGFNITGGSGTVAVSNTTMTGTSSGDMVKVNTGTQSWTFTNSPMTQTAGRALNVTNKTQNGMSFDAASTVTVSAGTTDGALTLSTNSGTGNTFAFGKLALTTTGTARALVLNSTGTVNNTDTTSTLSTTDTATVCGAGNCSAAIDATSATLGLTFQSASVSGTNAHVVKAIALTSVNGSLTVNGGSISTNAGRVADIDTGTASVTYDGTISNTGAAATGIRVANKTGGTVTFNGATKTLNTSANPAVTLSSNTGATIDFTGGGLGITTTSGAGFNATGGGTVDVTGANNTIGSTTGTALTVSSTTIGSSGLLFKSISANGGANGIVLSNTGTLGGLTVNGDGANVAVGGNASGGTIANMTGADATTIGVTTSGVGVYLNNTKNVVLQRMTINGTNTNFGIRGFAVDGFTLQYSTVNGINGTAHNALPDDAGEGSIYFGNTGTNGILTQGIFTNNAISGGFWDNMHVVNTAGTATITLKGNTFGSNLVTANANSSLIIEARGASTVVNSVVGGPGVGEPNTFTGAHADLANFTGQTGTTMDVQFKNNTLSNNYVPNNLGGGSLNLSSQGVMTFVVDSNSMTGADGSAVTLFKASAGTSYSGKLSNNTIGVVGVPDSASKSGNGIFLSAAGTGTIGLTIVNNSIRNWHNNGGMYFDNTGGSYTANFTIQGNTVAEPGLGSFTDLAITDGGNTTSDTINVCAVIGGSTAALKNSFSEVVPGSGDVYIGASGANGGHSFNLPGYAGGASLANVQTFVTGNNTLSGGSTVIAYDDNGAPIAGTFTGTGTSCPTPP